MLLKIVYSLFKCHGKEKAESRRDSLPIFDFVTKSGLCKYGESHSESRKNGGYACKSWQDQPRIEEVQ